MAMYECLDKLDVEKRSEIRVQISETYGSAALFAAADPGK
jgi:hypothetical protein